MHNHFAPTVPRKVPIPQYDETKYAIAKNVKMRSDIARGPLNRLVRSYRSKSTPYQVKSKYVGTKVSSLSSMFGARIDHRLSSVDLTLGNLKLANATEVLHKA